MDKAKRDQLRQRLGSDVLTITVKVEELRELLDALDTVRGLLDAVDAAEKDAEEKVSERLGDLLDGVAEALTGISTPSAVKIVRLLGKIVPEEDL